MNPKTRSMTDADAAEIRALSKTGLSQKKIADHMMAKLNIYVSTGTVASILNGRTYVPRPSPFKFTAGGSMPRNIMPYHKP